MSTREGITVGIYQPLQHNTSNCLQGGKEPKPGVLRHLIIKLQWREKSNFGETDSWVHGDVCGVDVHWVDEFQKYLMKIHLHM